ncbi:homocysteine S-methyltransferase family protein [Rosettibacter firmus]|uniref:homocysteine S-methyltransferase family protein n=1 Tax=Rosettibacter firmus TaxID=3111522 RepID=UPI00336BF47D
MSERLNLLKLHNQLKRPLILDGAMGSLLIDKGVISHPLLWTALSNINNPDLVKNIHYEYIKSGAEIIITNTFRTNPYVINKSNMNINTNDIVKKAIEIAFESRGEKEIIIAGSNAPAEDCYQRERTISYKELEYNHKTHIDILWENNVDIIWNETQSHKDEIEIICNHCYKNKIPFVVSLFFDEDLKILSGEYLYDIVEYINSFEPAAIGFNCIKPSAFIKYIEKYSLPPRWGFYFNCGAGNYNDENIVCGISPENYVNIVKSLLDLKPIFVGTCCGSNPSHIKAIKDLFNEIYRN